MVQEKIKSPVSSTQFSQTNEDLQTNAKEKCSRMDCIPILHVRGTHYAVGKAIGRTFKAMIQDLLDTWPYFNDILWKAYQQDDGRRVYEKCLENCQTKFPNYVDEIRGMADGCELPFEKLFLLNIDSIMESVTDKKEESIAMRGATGCTSIICNKPEAVLLAHTEDAMCEILNRTYIVSAEILDSEGAILEKFTTFSYAGPLMGYTMGFNEHGMVYSVNSLFPSIHKNGTPRAFLSRKILGAENLESLLDTLRDAGTGISDGLSLNVHFANKDKSSPPVFYNIETLPPSVSTEGTSQSLLDVVRVDPGQFLVHCNKYLRFNAVKEQSLPVACSTNRHEAIEKYPEPTNLTDVKFLLSDQSNEDFPVYLCDEIHTKLSHIKTVAVGVFNLVEKTWSIYLGKPSESDPVAVLPMNFWSR